MNNGDVVFRVPIWFGGLIRFGFHNHAFLRFCKNHVKPFGFRWQFMSESCPKCGQQFVEDETRRFVMITHGFTVIQQFKNGAEVGTKAEDEWPDVIGV